MALYCSKLFRYTEFWGLLCDVFVERRKIFWIVLSLDLFLIAPQFPQVHFLCDFVCYIPDKIENSGICYFLPLLLLFYLGQEKNKTFINRACEMNTNRFVSKTHTYFAHAITFPSFISYYLLRHPMTVQSSKYPGNKHLWIT